MPEIAPMKYISTRGDGTHPPISFAQALVAGLGRDGGLFVPEGGYPRLTQAELTELAELPYGEVAVRIMARFTAPDFTPTELRPIIDEAYATFTPPKANSAIIPITQIDHRIFLAELFHGPTLAFKDLPMQPLARLFSSVLATNKQEAVILAATSGDTGSAALAAFAGLPNIKVFVLYPEGRISPIQEKQMTAIAAKHANCLAVSVTADFDACQALVKQLFADLPFRDAVKLAAVNSINWGRIIAQIPYYFSLALACGGLTHPVSFAVPTGNFGNIFAGFIAWRMGAPIRRLVCASNRNDILTRFFTSLVMERRAVEPSLSPSMDIQVASNFERLLFELLGRDAGAVRRYMAEFAEGGRFAISRHDLGEEIDLFTAACFDDKATLAEVARVAEATGVVLDPHSAIGIAAARAVCDDDGDDGDNKGAVIALATAHPAKFPEAVDQAIGQRPALPPSTAGIVAGKGHKLSCEATAAAVKALIKQNI
ncbi:MAG: threonine synthase [Proteobacteria bacterium]|nr:threonine synthase [Pseudomonadota bacterium]